MHNSFKLTTAALAVLGTVTLASANHIDFIQDDSDSSNGVTDATFSLSVGSSGTVTDMQVGEPADILGGTRVVTLTGGGFGGTFAAEKVAGTEFINVTNTNVSAGDITLNYPDILNSDFDTRWDAIDVAIQGLSIGTGDPEFDAFLTVESSAGSGTAGSGRIEGSVVGDSTTLRFLFSDPAFSAVDFSDVDGVTLEIQTAIIGTDFQIASITREAIPEPASLGLLGLAGLGLLRRRTA